MANDPHGLDPWKEILNDIDYAELAANFEKIDRHDQSPGRGATLPDGGILDTARLRYDDEVMIAAAVAWGQQDKVGQKGIMVLTHINHKKAVVKRLKEEGFRPIQSDNLQAPNGAMLYVRTSGDMMSGVAVDALWIHEDCPPRVAQALTPCLKKHA